MKSGGETETNHLAFRYSEVIQVLFSQNCYWWYDLVVGNDTFGSAKLLNISLTSHVK